MFGTVSLTDPDPCLAAATPHEQQPTIPCQRGLALVIGGAEKTRRFARRAAVADGHLPDVEVATAVRRKNERFAICRPGRLSIPLWASGDTGPFRVGRHNPEVTANAQREAAVRCLRRI